MQLSVAYKPVGALNYPNTKGTQDISSIPNIILSILSPQLDSCKSYKTSNLLATFYEAELMRC